MRSENLEKASRRRGLREVDVTACRSPRVHGMRQEMQNSFANVFE
jgi:hypothetical protein